jgi:hypothetical protein
VSLTSNL